MASNMEDPILEEIRLRVFGYNVSRNVYNEEEFQKLHVRTTPPPEITVFEKLRSDFRFSGDKFKRIIFTMFPFLTWIPRYNFHRSLVGDLLSGINAGFTFIPQALTVAMLSQCFPVYAVFSLFFSTLLYILFGTSRHVAIGSYTILNVMMTEMLQNLNAGRFFNGTNVHPKPVNASSAYRFMRSDAKETALQREVMTLTASTTCLVGLIQLFFGFLQIGCFTTYLSEIVMSAFICAATVLVIIVQIAFILGLPLSFSSGPFGVFYNLHEYFDHFPTTNSSTVLIFMVCMFFLWLGRFLRFECRYFSFHLPIEFFLIVIFAAISHSIPAVSRLHRTGAFPMTLEFPTPMLPTLKYIDIILVDAIYLAFVSYVFVLAMAKMFALKHGYIINNNQELIAVGACNIVGSFFRTFPVSCTLSRTVIQEKSGGTSQIAGFIAACIMIAVVMNLGAIFQALPEAVLSAIVVSNLFPLLENFHQVPLLWIKDKYDFSIWVMTFACCIILGLAIGLIFSVIIALGTICIRTHRMNIVLVGPIPETNIYRNFLEYPQTLEVTGVKIFQCCSSIYFANMLQFKEMLVKMSCVDPEALEACRLRALIKRELSHIRQEEMKCSAIDYCTVCVQSNIPHTVSIGQKRSIDSILGSECQPALRQEEEMSPVCQQDMSAVPDCTLPPASTGHSLKDVDISSNRVNPSLWLASQKTSEMQMLPQSGRFHTIVLDFSMVQFIDSAGVRLLLEVWYMFRECGISILIANCQSSVLLDLERNQFFCDDAISKAIVFISVHDAVLYASRCDACEEKDMAEQQCLNEDEARDPGCEMNEEPTCTEDLYLQTQHHRIPFSASCHGDTASDNVIPGVDLCCQNRARGWEPDPPIYSHRRAREKQS